MRMMRIMCCLCLALVGMLAISQPALAARPPLQEGEQRVNVDVTYPSVEVTPGQSCQFEVDIAYLTYQGEGEARVFDLVTTPPKDWDVYLTEEYAIKETKMRSITIDPAYSTPTKLKVVVTAPLWYIPDPGEYPITLEVICHDAPELKGSIELKAVILHTYVLDMAPATERYNTSAIAGKDNYFSLVVNNYGTATINDVAFSSDKPEGWAITFTPDKIDSMDADSSREVEVNIKPPRRTIAGDYSIVLKSEGKQTSAKELDIRVTVETPTVWGWVGVGIILVVVAGLVFVFMRFSRR